MDFEDKLKILDRAILITNKRSGAVMKTDEVIEDYKKLAALLETDVRVSGNISMEPYVLESLNAEVERKKYYFIGDLYAPNNGYLSGPHYSTLVDLILKSPAEYIGYSNKNTYYIYEADNVNGCNARAVYYWDHDQKLWHLTTPPEERDMTNAGRKGHDQCRKLNSKTVWWWPLPIRLF